MFLISHKMAAILMTLSKLSHVVTFAQALDAMFNFTMTILFRFLILNKIYIYFICLIDAYNE